jgi:hypothetical protein
MHMRIIDVIDVIDIVDVIDVIDVIDRDSVVAPVVSAMQVVS